MASSLGLDQETAPWLHRLPVGQGIVSLRPRISVPVLVAFPCVPVRKGLIRDEDFGAGPGRPVRVHSYPL